MQLQLKAMDLNLDVDGIYGPQTAGQVKAFCDNPQHRVQYSTDGKGLPLLSHEIVRAVRQQYDKLPSFTAVPTQKQFIPQSGILPASTDPAKQQFLQKPGPFLEDDSDIAGTISTIFDAMKDTIQAIFKEQALRDALKSMNPHEVIKEFKIKVTPKIKKLTDTYDKFIKQRKYGYRRKLLEKDYRRQANDLILKHFNNWIRKYNLKNKIEKIANSKAGQFASKSATPVSWLLRFWHVLEDLFNLFVKALKGTPIDEQWLNQLKQHLSDVADALIIGWISELIAAGIIAAGIAAGVIAGPAIVITAVIIIIMAFLIGLLFDKLEFSPTKFISESLAKFIASFLDPQQTANFSARLRLVI